MTETVSYIDTFGYCILAKELLGISLINVCVCVCVCVWKSVCGWAWVFQELSLSDSAGTNPVLISDADAKNVSYWLACICYQVTLGLES